VPSSTSSCVHAEFLQQGETAIDIARRKQHAEIVHLLTSSKHNVSFFVLDLCVSGYVCVFVCMYGSVCFCLSNQFLS